MNEYIVKDIQKTATLIKTHYSSIATLKEKLAKQMEELKWQNIL